MRVIIYILYLLVIMLFFFKIPIVNFFLQIDPNIIEIRDLSLDEMRLIRMSSTIMKVINLITLFYSVIVFFISLIFLYKENSLGLIAVVSFIVSIVYILFYILAYGFSFW